MPVYELALPTLMKANLPKATSYNVSSYGSLLRAALPYEPTSWWPMADTIKVMSLGADPQTGGEAITIQVQYSDGRNATILLKPGRLPSIGGHLRDELNVLAKVLQQAPISQAD